MRIPATCLCAFHTRYFTWKKAIKRRDLLTPLLGLLLFGGAARAGTIFVAENGTGTIDEYTTSGALVSTSLISGLNSPDGIAISGADLFVLNGTSLSEYTTSGALVNASLVSGLTKPHQVAVAGTDLFITNGDPVDNLSEYTTSGAVVKAPLISGLSTPHGVAVSGSNLYIVNNGNGNPGTGSIAVYTTSGALVNPSLITGLSGPEEIAISGSNIFVANYDTGTIGEYTTSGATVNAALISGLNGPYGLAIDGSNLFVTNANIGTVSEYTTSGTLVNAALISGLNGPTGIAVSDLPQITPNGVVPIYSTAATIQSGEWVSIYGINLATSTALYSGSLPYPASLAGTTVMIDNKPALLYYVSATLIDLIAPADTATGSVPVSVTTSAGTANATVTLAQFGPSFFLLDNKHVAGIILRTNGAGSQGGGTYDFLGPTGSSLGYPTVAAKAGDVVELFANGLGPTNPAVPAGQGSSVAAPTTNPVTLLINNVSVTPSYAGASSEAGIYQINLTIPAGLGSGDVPLAASVGGVQTPSTIVISLQ